MLVLVLVTPPPALRLHCIFSDGAVYLFLDVLYRTRTYQLAAVGVMSALAGLFGQWPPPPHSSQSCAEGKATSSTRCTSKATAPTSMSGGGIPADAVPVSQEEAVSLVDGK